jgi:hypothetical protein
MKYLLLFMSVGWTWISAGNGAVFETGPAVCDDAASSGFSRMVSPSPGVGVTAVVVSSCSTGGAEATLVRATGCGAGDAPRAARLPA